ncbi:hypothetical protein AB833_30110 [Chromatiales bacterium (ex Bugula neritina AB1)]|nr:hypothetical protein AB833_30110 [Chromatiales bacterium (ex Bugula neritina AB1)]
MTVDDANAQVTLHDEAIEELGLNDQPFIDNKKRNRFSDSTTQKIRSALEQHLRFGESLHLFLGEEGAGKTVFLSQLIKNCKSTIKPFVAKGAENFEALAFLAAVLNQLGGEAAESVSDHVDALIPLFENLAEENLSVVLAIDDAHLAPIEEIAELIDIMPSFTDREQKNARLLLTAEPRLKDELKAIADEFEELTLQHATTTLYPLDKERVREYLTTRLNQVGHTDVFPFTDKSIEKIHHDSGGLPARINPLAAKYLNNVYAGGIGSGGSGLLAALGWPILAMGAAAVGLIAWGLSMFFSGTAEDTSLADAQSGVDNITLVAEQDDIVVTDVSTDSITPVTATSVASNDITTGPEIAEEDDGLVLPQDLQTETSTAMASQVSNVQNDAGELTAGNLTDTTPTADNVTSTQTTIAADTSSTTAAPESVVAEIVQPVATEADDTVAEALENTPVEPTETEIVIASIDATKQEPAVMVPEPATVETVVAVEPKKVTNADRVPEPVAAEPVVPESVAVAIDDAQVSDQSPVVPAATPDPVSVAVAVAVDAAPTSSGAVAVDTGNNGVAVQLPTLNSAENTLDSQTTIEKAIENERWVLFQAPTKFTVQLATSRERSYIIELAQTLEAENPIAIYPFLTTNSNNPVFGLLSGLYETRTEAIQAVAEMQPATKQFGVWIRPISDLQAAIKKR